MALFGLLKKKVNNAAGEVRKLEKKDLMEATVGIAVLVMYADGEAEDSERDKIAKILANTPALAAFGSEVQAAFNRFDSLCKEAGPMMARVQIMREIGDVKGDAREMEDVLVTGLTVAMADGELEDAEAAVLRKVATQFGLRIEDYLA